MPIIGIGFDPKLLTQVYDAKTEEITARLRTAYFMAVEKRNPALADIQPFQAPALQDTAS